MLDPAVPEPIADSIGLTQTTDFLSFVGYFSPCRAKNNLQKKKSTMLPQATAAFA
jgi:hypothetical protein